MKLPFIGNTAKKREHIVAIDLGSNTTKAVWLQRRGPNFSLAGYATMAAPQYEQGLAAGPLADHLKAIMKALGAKTKLITFVLGVNDSIVRHAEVPQIPLADLRLMIKSSPKTYLQQELPGYVFDCFILPPPKEAEAGEAAKESAKKAAAARFRALVGGAKQDLVREVVTASKNAGYVADQVVPGLVAPVNAFEGAQPEKFSQEVVALVDLGFKSSSISVLIEGDLVLTRVVGIGGDKITAGLAETLGISYAEAEGIKIGMTAEVQSNLEPLLIPLGRELRASIDFFEHQQDKVVSSVFVSGAAARSEFYLQVLQNEMMAPCQAWNPTSCLQMALPSGQLAEVEGITSQLAAAVGGAACLF